MAILAALVWCATQFWKSPPLAHLLWLIVLLKLITLPVYHIDAGWWTHLPPNPAPSEAPKIAEVERSARPAHDATSHSESMTPRATEQTSFAQHMQRSASLENNQAQPAELKPTRLMLPSWPSVRSVLTGVWLVVAAAISGITAIRIVRFRRMLSSLAPAADWLQSMSDELAKRMGVHRRVSVLQVEGQTAPFVWCFGARAS